MAAAFDQDDAEDFLSKVDDVSRLIDGLASNKLSAEYVTKRTRELGLDDGDEGASALASAAAATADAAGTAGGRSDAVDRGVPTRTATGVAGNDSSSETDCDETAVRDDEEIKRKVSELQERRQRRLRARARYEEHMKNAAKDAGVGGRGGGNQQSTDYDKWELWTPSDEEDELFDNLQPEHDPGFKAMSKDIEDRHKRMKQQRQLSERHRVAGNDQYKRRQFAEAMQTYRTGIELGEKTNATLHSNCAMAALKCGCFASAIEHCDKALHIIEFFHNNSYEDVGGDESRDKHIALRVKTYQRRATARMKLAHYVDAVRDFEKAVALSRLEDDAGAARGKETALFEKELDAAKVALEEERREKSVSGTCKANGDLTEMKRIEGLVITLSGAHAGDADNGQTFAKTCIELCSAMSRERESAADARTCVRVCGGLEALSSHIITANSVEYIERRPDDDGATRSARGGTSGLLPLPDRRQRASDKSRSPSLLVHALATLRASCGTKKNVDFVTSQPQLLGAILAIATRADVSPSRSSREVGGVVSFESVVLASELLYDLCSSCSSAAGSDAVRSRLLTALRAAENAPVVSIASVLECTGVDELAAACASATSLSFRHMSSLLGALSLLLVNASARTALYRGRDDVVVDDEGSHKLVAGLVGFFIVCSGTRCAAGDDAATSSGGTDRGLDETCVMRLLQLVVNCLANSVLEQRPLVSVAGNRGAMNAACTLATSLMRLLGNGANRGYTVAVVVELMSFFINVLSDGAAADFVCDTYCGGALVQDIIDLSSRVELIDLADAAASRASVVLSKLARSRESVKARIVAVNKGTGVSNLHALVERGLLAATLRGASDAGGSADLHTDARHEAEITSTAIVDNVMRILAVCTTKNEHAEKAIALLASCRGFELVVQALDPSFTDSITGNSCLCISHIAGNAHAAEQLVTGSSVRHDTAEGRRQDVIELLVNVAHTRRGHAQRNAAIALAKLARMPQCLERARELHALEIIHNQFKSIASNA